MQYFPSTDDRVVINNQKLLLLDFVSSIKHAGELLLQGKPKMMGGAEGYQILMKREGHWRCT